MSLWETTLEEKRSSLRGRPHYLFWRLCWLTFVRASENPKLQVMKEASFQKPTRKSFSLLTAFIHSDGVKRATQTVYSVCSVPRSDPNIVCMVTHTCLHFPWRHAIAMCWAELMVCVNLLTIFSLPTNTSAWKKERNILRAPPVPPLPFRLIHACFWINVKTDLGLYVMWSSPGLALVGGPSRKSLIFLLWSCSSRYVWIYRK